MQVKVKSDRRGCGKIFIDGQEVKAVRSIHINLEAENLNTVELECLPDAIEFAGEAQVIVLSGGKKYKLVENCGWMTPLQEKGEGEG